MTPSDRKDTYLSEFDKQRLEISHAYGRMISYYSKLTTKPELIECMTDEDYAKLRTTMIQAKRLIKTMEKTISEKW